MATIRINGITVETKGGGSICISNGNVIVDGNKIDIGKDTYNVTIEGNVNNLEVTGRVDVKGKVEGDIRAGGSISCGDVGGSVDAGGSVHADNIDGDIDAGGSVSIRKR